MHTSPKLSAVVLELRRILRAANGASCVPDPGFEGFVATVGHSGFLSRDYCCFVHSLDRMTSLFESMTSKSVPFCPLPSSSLKRKNAAGPGWGTPRGGAGRR